MKHQVGGFGKTSESVPRGRNGRWLSGADIKKAVKMVSDGVTVQKTMEALDYSPSTARSHTEILSQNQEFIAGLAEVRGELKVLGVDSRYMAVKVKSGMEATKPSLNDQGEVVGKYPDWSAQEKFVRIACKLLGYEVEDRSTGPAIQVNAIFNLIRQAETERGLPPSA